MTSEQGTEDNRHSVRFEGSHCTERYDAWFEEHPGIGVLAIRTSWAGEDPYIELDYCLLKARLH